jgi:malonate decarboxylase alpha subunit
MTQTTSHPQISQRSWSTRRDQKARRLARVASLMQGRVLPTAKTAEFLETLLSPGDMVALEGDNQKQADFLSRTLAQLNPQKIHDLHLVLSAISLPEHLDLFERGIARKADFAYAGEQSLRVAQLVEDKKLEIGAIHTYIELYARMFVDLSPQVSLVCAEKGDAQGNLYTGFSTEDIPTIVEATAFHDGIVVAQVNEITDDLPRIDIPGSWVDVIVQADKAFAIEPLFTRPTQYQ